MWEVQVRVWMPCSGWETIGAFGTANEAIREKEFLESENPERQYRVFTNVPPN